MQFNDDVFTQFGDLGYTGTYNDRFFEFLGDQGYTGTLQDRMYKWFGDLGYTGGFADRWFQWAVGGFLVGEAPVISDLVVDEGAPSIDFTVTGADGTAYIVLSANAVETAEDIFAWSDPDTLFTFPVTLGGVSESLDFSAVPDGTYYIHVIVANGALLSNVLSDGPYLIEAAPIRSKTYRGTAQTDNGTNVVSGNIDIGTASANRVVIVASIVNRASQTGDPVVVVNGVTLTNVYAPVTGTYSIYFAYGVVSTGDGSQAFSSTFTNATFFRKIVQIWTAENLNSNTVITGSSTNSNTGFTAISANEDDYIFATRLMSSTELLGGGATKAPDRQASDGPYGGLYSWSGDWTVDTTTASFDLGNDNEATTTTAYVRFN